MTSSRLDSSFKFFNTGGDKLVYTTPTILDKVRDELDGLATVVPAGDPVSLTTMLDDLGDRGIQRLMVEGGGTIHTQFLTHGLADEIHLAIAPFFVGDPSAPRFVNPGTFPQDPAHRMQVAEVRQIGDIVFARYLPKR